MSPGTGPGILSSTSNVSFNASTTFAVGLNGATAGSGYDQLNVTGTVNLGGAALNVTVGFTPTAGAQFIILQNDGANPVLGTFNGLPQGASLTINGQPFQISYQGGDGNDVVLTFQQLIACSPRPPVNVQATNNGNGSLRVDLAANQNSITPNLQSLVVTRLDNAAITINGAPVQLNVPVGIGPATTSQFFVQRAPGGQGQATTAEFRVQDAARRRGPPSWAAAPARSSGWQVSAARRGALAARERAEPAPERPRRSRRQRRVTGRRGPQRSTESPKKRTESRKRCT